MCSGFVADLRWGKGRAEGEREGVGGTARAVRSSTWGGFEYRCDRYPDLNHPQISNHQNRGKTMKPSEFVAPVVAYAQYVQNHCTWPEGKTPLLADRMDMEVRSLPRWEGLLLSNLACQQNFLRTLDGLGVLTGDASFHQKADEWIGCALEKLRHPASGLLYWGGHTSYDLLTDQPVLGNHELKCVYPHYAYLYRVDPDTIRGFVEACWHAHIWDWSTLLFNRHGNYEAWEKKWDGEFSGGPLPIVENTALSFINTGSDLILSGALLHALSGDETPLRWARHLLSRYDQVRHPETGLAGYQFNHRDPCRVRMSFKPPFDKREDLNEVTVVTNGVIKTRYGRVAVTLLNVVEVLGEEKGKPFLDFVIADLEALAEHVYDAGDRCFHPAINNGERLDPAYAMEGVGYCPPSKLKKVPADGLMFLSYARAYQATGMPQFLDMAKNMAAGMGWGDLNRPLDFEKGASPATEDVWVNTGQNDACALFGLLALHEATGDGVLLQSAESLGRRLLQQYRMGDLIASGSRDGTANIDTALPLALLHLEAARQGNRQALPAFYPNNTYFDPKIVIRRWAQEKARGGA